MHHYWNWSIFSSGTYPTADSFFDTLLSGLLHTLVVAAIACPPAITVGLAIGSCANRLNKTVRSACQLWVDLLGNAPLLVQLYVWSFVVPTCLPLGVAQWFVKLPNHSLLSGVVCVASYSAARIARQIARFRTPRHVPPDPFLILISETVVIVQTSCIALAISIINQIAAAGSPKQLTLQTFEACSAALLIYILVSMLTRAVIKALREPVNTIH